MLLHQPLDFLHHAVEVVVNFLDFIPLGCRAADSRSDFRFADPAISLIQLFQPSDVVAGKKI